MKLKTLLFAGASALTMSAMSPAAFAQNTATETMSEEADTLEAADTTPAADPQVLLAEWTGPYGGVPPFDQVDVAMFQPALEAAMESARAEIDKLTAQDAAPTFENTILPMEKGAGELSRALAVYGIWASNLNGPEVQAVQREVAPKLAAFQDALYQDAA
ncbi:MAG TPA: M3 family peptidase, partial [Henriciella sp.]|nr:M3 family peptidase [Henriciella sp.]